MTWAAVAFAGLLSGPSVVVIAAGILYRNLVGIPGFKPAMAGIAAVAVGMLLRLGIGNCSGLRHGMCGKLTR